MEYAVNEKPDMVSLASLGPLPEALDPAQLAPLSLAYMGDTVYDLFVRTELLENTTLTAHGLHERAARLVNARAQAAAFRRIEPMLTGEELAIFRRGRNSHIGTVPRSASIMDYRIATGLEALLGFLYLSGRDGRIRELMRALLTEAEEGLNNENE